MFKKNQILKINENYTILAFKNKHNSIILAYVLQNHFNYDVNEIFFQYEFDIEQDIQCIEFSPDNINLAVGCEDGIIRVLNLEKKVV